LQPPIVASGETAYASQVLLKGPIVRACWCAIRDEPWVCPYTKKWFRCQDHNLLEGMSRWFPSNIGEIRICVDLRNMNDACLHDPFPTPFTDEVLDNVGGHEVYSFTDGFSRYH
jgi:hypothetical protein